MKKNRNKSNIAKTLLKFDIFGERPELTVDGESSYSTWNGLIVSLVIIAISLKYGFDKFNKMINFDDTSYKEVREPGALDMEATFTADDFDASIAFYIGEWLKYVPPEEYEDYVTLKAHIAEIEYTDPDPSTWFKAYPHPMRRCTEDDIKRVNNNKLGENFGLFQCMDDVSSLRVRGNG